MAKMCNWTPKIKVRNGVKIEEKDSKLFQDIYRAVKNNEKAWNMWAYTKTTEFKQLYKNVEYDELGEVTFPSFIKAMGLEEAYRDSKGIDSVAKDYKVIDTVYTEPSTAIAKMQEINAKEGRFLASLVKTSEGYKIQIEMRNAQTLEKGRAQSFNYAMSMEIVKLLAQMGFGVGFVSNPKFKGLFDPTHATMEEGLLTVIRIVKGLQGEEALPEEFSHLIIEGLLNNPLVQRLMNTLNQDIIREVLGDMYDRYNEEYQGDPLKMQKEAAGKMLSQLITDRGTISEPIIQPKRTMLSRVWNWAKGMFGRITGKQINNARENAHRAIADIYNLIATREVFSLVDKNGILKGSDLYFLDDSLKEIEGLARKGDKLLAQIDYGEGQSKTGYKKRKLTKDALKQEKKYLESSPYKSVDIILKDIHRRLKELADAQAKLEKIDKLVETPDINKLNEASKMSRKILYFINGYEQWLRIIETLGDDGVWDKFGLVNQESGQLLAETATKVLRLFMKLNTWDSSVKAKATLAVSRKMLGADRIKGVGKDREQLMEVDQIVHHATKDISFVDRWFSAMSDASDAMLVVFDQLVKQQQFERDLEMMDWRDQILRADKKLREAGYTSEFMLELDAKGKRTGRLISEYDIDAYKADRLAKMQALRKEQEEKKRSERWYRSEMKKWENQVDKDGNKRIITVFVNPEHQEIFEKKGIKAVPEDAVMERFPNPKWYPGNANKIESLPEAQKAYYKEVIKIKRTMMSKIPHRGQGIYKAIFISKGLIEGILDTSAGNPVKAFMDSISKQFTRRPDEIGFGTGESFKDTITEIIENEPDSMLAAEDILKEIAEAIDEDVLLVVRPETIKRIIDRNKREKKSTEDITAAVIERLQAENYVIVDTDLADVRLQRLPVYYSRRLPRLDMLSPDFSSCLLAYSGMAVNYEKMNEVIDLLEVMKDYVTHDRKYHENEGGKEVKTRFEKMGQVYSSYVLREGRSTNIVGRLQDFIDTVVYEERKEKGKTIKAFGANIDIEKTLDTIKNYNGVMGLGLNLFSTFTNVAVGKLQQWIEAAAGEYFNAKDYGKACLQYSELIWEHLAEMNSPIKKGKLSLLIQMFDPMRDQFENYRDTNLQKNPVARILGNGALAYIGMNAGEHMLRCQTMLAILNHIKLIDTKDNNKEVSLYDALKVVEKDGVYRLEIDEGLCYEREIIDQSGSPATNKNFGKPVFVTVDGKKKKKVERVSISSNSSDTDKYKNYTQFIFKKKKVVQKVNDRLNGAFGPNEKGPVHKIAWKRLVMQYRQWMPAHYGRRFAGAHYDGDLEQWVEGYYVTFFNTVIKNLAKDITRGRFTLLKELSNLSDHEKANLRRATAEISEFLILMLLVRLGGKVKDKDRGWWEKMRLYIIRRMKLEVGASMPFNPDFLKNIWQMMRQPVAATDAFERGTKLLYVWNLFDEIETGTYQGWSEWGRDAYLAIPLLGQITKAYVFDDSMFSMYEQED